MITTEDLAKIYNKILDMKPGKEIVFKRSVVLYLIQRFIEQSEKDDDNRVFGLIPTECLDNMDDFNNFEPYAAGFRDGNAVAIKKFIEYLNNNAFALRHDMELIEDYAKKYLTSVK